MEVYSREPKRVRRAAMASQTLATTEALVIDGTNGVTRASREGFPEASLSLGLAGAALVLSVFVVRRAPKWLPLILFAPAAFDSA